MVVKQCRIYAGIVFGIFVLLVSAQLWTDGMFVDGVYYASIARNLSEGSGNLWNLSFSNTHDAAFYGHPPLAIGFLSVFYKIFGDAFWIERVYSILTYVISGLLILKIWGNFTQAYQLCWIPLLLWCSIPTIQWAAANNILENTVTVFVLASIYTYLKSSEGRRIFWLSITGILLLAGFLSKGFTALFPLAMPVIYQLVYRKNNIFKALLETAFIAFCGLLFLAVWMCLDIEVYHYLINYFQIQVIESIESRVNVDTRWHIIIRMIEELLVPAILGLLLFGASRLMRATQEPIPYKHALQFFILGLSGVVPVMVSMKQSGFYIVPAFPVLTLGMAFLILPFGRAITSRIESLPQFHFYQRMLFSLIVICVLVSGVFLFGKIGRDQYFLEDWSLIQSQLPAGSTINECLQEDNKLNVLTYASRYGRISIEMSPEVYHPYFLVQKEKKNACNLTNYTLIPLPTAYFDLFRRIE